MTYQELLKELQNNECLFQTDLFGNQMNIEIINISIQGKEIYVTYAMDKHTNKEKIGCCCLDCRGG